MSIIQQRQLLSIKWRRRGIIPKDKEKLEVEGVGRKRQLPAEIRRRTRRRRCRRRWRPCRGEGFSFTPMAHWQEKETQHVEPLLSKPVHLSKTEYLWGEARIGLLKKRISSQVGVARTCLRDNERIFISYNNNYLYS